MRLLLLLGLCGCGAPDFFDWGNYPGQPLDLTTPLASNGGKASIIGFNHQYDVDSTNLEVAMAVYHEVSSRSIDVTGVKAGTSLLELRKPGEASIAKKLTITVADIGQIGLGSDARALFWGDRFLPQFVIQTAGGGPLVGGGAVACSVTGALSVTSDCLVGGDRPGTVVLTGTAGAVTITVPLTVALFSDIRSITLGALEKPDNLFPQVRITAMTDAGPVYGGAFQCSADGIDPSALSLDQHPVSGSGSVLTFVNAPGGTHTVTCTLGTQSASEPVQL